MALKIELHREIGNFQLNMKASTESKRIGILGASGCGKSMTLKCIAGIEKFANGFVILDDKVLADTAKKINLKPQKRKLGYLFQNYALFPTMTVEKNIAMGLSGLSKTDIDAKVAEMIKRFKLEGLEKQIPDQLSGGQQQRTAIARIMAYEPGLIMLDEPFSALDGHLKEKLVLEMQEMLLGYQGTVLLVSHNREEIYQLTDEVFVMADGKLICQGPTKEVFRNPKVLGAAKLTGCKNISPAEKRGEYLVYAKDWDLLLHTAEPVNDDCTYVGIRAHHLQPVFEKSENCFAVQLNSVIAAPFEVVRLVKNADSPQCREIWWKVSKNGEEEDEEQNIPPFLKIPKANLLLLTE
ncbi:MAG: sulfate/molybdate ABC transporter ATP-binding protein [Bacillota bacterium]|jgi:molybdate transport system ATP-binding protein